ncbi:hypothetical protein BGP_5257 [Beggiatoa sp. PS]|nr:hypothetical protein BGP_5257 [Beggiatoa sp. PS]
MTTIELIGNNLKKLRNNRGLGKSEMAGELGTNYQNIGRWEGGQVDMKLSTFIQLAEFFDVSTDELIRRNVNHSK